MAIITHNVANSDHIKAFAYDDSARVLSVKFSHDRTDGEMPYDFRDVPLGVFHGWLRWVKGGHSPGAYFHRFINNKYERIVEQTKEKQ